MNKPGKIEFRRATRKRAHARIALIGPPGTGKTYSAAVLAAALVRGTGKRVAVIDTEHGTASLYADEFDFDSLELESFHPERYIEAIHAADAAGYGALVIDSASHAWAGKDGILEFVDLEKKRGSKALSPWGEATPIQTRFVEAMTTVKMHLIVTMRSKMTFAQDEVEEGGRKKTVIRKLGLQPVQRDGLEYEFDIVGDMTQDNDWIISKSRMKGLQNAIIRKPDARIGAQILEWLNAGIEQTTAPAGPSKDGRRKEAHEKLNAYATLFGAAKCRELCGKSTRDMTLEELEAAVAKLERAQSVETGAIATGDPPPKASSGPPELKVVPPTGEAPSSEPASKQDQSETQRQPGDGEREPSEEPAQPQPEVHAPFISITDFWRRIKAAGLTVEQVNADAHDMFGVANAGGLQPEMRVAYLEMLADPHLTHAAPVDAEVQS